MFAVNKLNHVQFKIYEPLKNHQNVTTNKVYVLTYSTICF